MFDIPYSASLTPYAIIIIDVYTSLHFYNFAFLLSTFDTIHQSSFRTLVIETTTVRPRNEKRE